MPEFGNATVHQRTLIRTAISKLLINQTNAEDRVFTSRPSNVWQEELTSICIYNSTDNPKQKGYIGQPWLKRDLDISVLLLVKESIKIDEDLDALALQVESIIHPLQFLNDPDTGDELCETIGLGRSEFHLAQVGQIVMGSILLTIPILYNMDFPLRGNTADYLRSDTDWHVNNVDTTPSVGAPQVQDNFLQPT